ncbi:MAG: YkvA family protein [Cyanobacteria bacterium P01_E01_bin.34]
MKGPSFPLYRWFRQGIRNPATRQWVIAGVLLYLVSPIDVVPSFFPGVGEIDDVVLVGLLLSELAQVWWSNKVGPNIEEADPKSKTHPSGKESSSTTSQVVDVDAVSIED